MPGHRFCLSLKPSSLFSPLLTCSTRSPVPGQPKPRCIQHCCRRSTLEFMSGREIMETEKDGQPARKTDSQRDRQNRKTHGHQRLRGTKHREPKKRSTEKQRDTQRHTGTHSETQMHTQTERCEPKVIPKDPESGRALGFGL